MQRRGSFRFRLALFCVGAPLAELGVRLNFDFSPVTRYIRRLRYQAQTGSGAFDFPADEADEVMKLVSIRMSRCVCTFVICHFEYILLVIRARMTDPGTSWDMNHLQM